MADAILRSGTPERGDECAATEFDFYCANVGAIGPLPPLSLDKEGS
jgi:hypothetical protein